MFPFYSTVHCWDYRRFVVGKANVPTEKEFQFCDEKIQKNFSNYSSWHYRSQLLPILYPHVSDMSRPISEAKLKEELELVITAAFTDPNDSSAWFYQRWLLGYSDPKLDLASVKITETQVTVSFTTPIDLANDGITISINTIPELNEGKWASVTGERSDAIWVQQGNFQSINEATLSVTKDEEIFNLDATKIQNGSIIGIKCPTFGYEFGAVVMEELRNQLNSCNQLLEYEPDSKWTLLTASLLMRSIDRFLYHEKTLEFLEKLEKIDHLRVGYYKDLASKWTVEMKLRSWIDSGEFLSEKADLSNLNLSTLYYYQYFAIAETINLQGNPNINKTSCKISLVKGCEVNF